MMLATIFDRAGLGHLIKGIEVVKGKSKPLQYFQDHQVRRIRDYLLTCDPELWLFCQFVYFCFIRPRSELRFLKVGDIYFEERKILIRSEFYEQEPGECLPPGAKNHQSQFVTIPDAFYPYIEHLQYFSPNSYVFPGVGGGPMGKNTMGNRFRQALDKLGFGKNFQMYSFKHTGAAKAVKAGIGLKELQLQLRHHSLDQVNEYLRGLGVMDFENLRENFPGL
jgi:integrase